VIPAQKRKRRRTTRLSAGGLDLRCRDPDLALAAGPGGVAGRRAQVVLGMGQARLARAVGRNDISWPIPCHQVLLSTGVSHNDRCGTAQEREILTLQSALAEAVLTAEAA
jgi:hypothetical protein